jgi:hypothetical protein
MSGFFVWSFGMEPSEFPTIRRTGIIFRPGDYGAKGSYTDADIEAMAGDTPLPIRMGHHDTLIERANRMGVCHRTFVGFDAAGEKVLMGEWDEPEPLAQLLAGVPKTVSAEIDLKTKRPFALALEVNPHIEGAAFFDAVDRAYAQFSKGEDVTPIEVKNSLQEQEDMSTQETVSTEQAKPSLLDSVKAFFKSAPAEDVAEFESALAQAKTGKTAREIELEAQVAQFEKSIEEMTAAKVHQANEDARREAAEFADGLVTDGRIEAKGNDAYNTAIALFSVAREYDKSKPELACFSEEFRSADFDARGAVKAVYESLPKFVNGEQVSDHDPTKGAAAMFEQEESTVIDPESQKVIAYNKEAADKIVEARLKASASRP